MFNFNKDIFLNDLTNRNSLADLLKGLAVVTMIQVHIVENFIADPFIESHVGKILLFLGGPPAAPIFMAVMGYFIAKSQKNQMQLIKRGIVLFSAGILLNFGLNLNLLRWIGEGRIDLNPFHYIFGVDILPLAGLSIIIISFIKKYNLSVGIVSVIILFISSSTVYLPTIYYPEAGFMQYFVAFFWGNYDWSYFPVFPWLTYPLLGYLFFQLSRWHRRFIENRSYLIVALLSIFLLLAITFEYALNIASDLKQYYHHEILFFLWSTLFIIFISVILSEIDVKAGNSFLLLYLKWLGKNVTAIYVFQWLIIGNIATEIYKTQNEKYIVIWFLGVLLGSSILTFLWMKYIKSKHASVALKK